MVLMLAGNVVKAERESGDKVTRAEPVSAQAEAGNLDILEADWTETFLEEATTFPASKFKDQVDALSGAFNRLIGATKFATPEEFIRSPAPAHIPSTWARVAVLDVDSARIGITRAVHDRTADVATVYDCVVTPRSDLSLLAATLRDRCAWIPVLMDAESRRRSKDEGLRIAERLNELGLDVYCAHAETGAIVEETANRLSTGRLRVHEHLEEWFAGYRRYRRDEKSEISETDQHLMRAMGPNPVHWLGLGKFEAHAASEDESSDPVEYVSGYSLGSRPQGGWPGDTLVVRWLDRRLFDMLKLGSDETDRQGRADCVHDCISPNPMRRRPRKHSERESRRRD